METNVFSGEPGRQLIERELLLAGIKIRAGCQDPKKSDAPLGSAHLVVVWIDDCDLSQLPE
jgi:hypothetical protein